MPHGSPHIQARPENAAPIPFGVECHIADFVGTDEAGTTGATSRTRSRTVADESVGSTTVVAVPIVTTETGWETVDGQ